MRDQLGGKGLLIAFICNHCPYVKAMGDRLTEDTDTLMAEGINVLALMSNDCRQVPDDSPANMLRFAGRHGVGFPYLVDEGQSVGRAYWAICTPYFFGLNKHGELQYRGRLDDVRMGNRLGRQRELVDAMRLIAETGESPKDQVSSMGCSIKWS